MQKLTDAELQAKLENYEAWALDQESGKLVSGFEFDNFEEAVSFLNSIADIAIEVGHHPDILIHDQKFVTILTSTEEPEGITDRDFELADKIEAEVATSVE